MRILSLATLSGGEEFAFTWVVYLLAPIAGQCRRPTLFEPRKRTITLEHFLSTSSGIDCDDSDDKSPGNESSMLDGDDPNYYKLTQSLKAVRDPRTKVVHRAGHEPAPHDEHEWLRSALVGGGVSIPRRHAPGLLCQRQWRAGGDRDSATGHGRHRLRGELSGRGRREDQREDVPRYILPAVRTP
jgi:hypothetical protein